MTATPYDGLVIETFRGLSMDDLATAVGDAVLRPVRVPDPAAVVRGVVLHTPSDPWPDPDLLTLCTDPARGCPSGTALAVREACVEDALAAAPPATAVFGVPDSARWSDVYDRVQWALRDSLGKLAVHDAFELADALATALGGAVAIEDAGRRVVSFSTVAAQPIDEVRRQGILDRAVPEHVEREEWYARLWRSDDVEEFTGGTESTSRVAVAVRAGDETLGSVWTIGSRATLNPEADLILRRSIPMVAACLTHHDHFASRGREARAQIVRQLLGGGGEAGQVLGYTLPAPAVLVAHRRGDAADDDDLRGMRLADVLSLQAHRFQGSGLAAAVDGHVYALLPVQDRPRLESQLKRAMSRTSAEAGVMAVSGTVDRTEGLPHVRDQVDRLLALYSRAQGAPGRIVYVEDELDDLVLAAIAEAVAELEPLRAGVVRRIVDHDRDHGTDYVATLRAWFDTGGDVAAAAARLHVHANTFRYRMSRASALFDLDLDRPDERLLVHLQLRLADFR